MLATEQNWCVRLGPPLNGWLSGGGDTLRLTAFGKTFRFEWHNYHGPMFVTARGDELRNPPGERNLWWKAFDLWLRQGKRTKDGECQWNPGMPCGRCQGNGSVPGTGKLTGLLSPCPACHGEGVTHTIPTEPWRGLR